MSCRREGESVERRMEKKIARLSVELEYLALAWQGNLLPNSIQIDFTKVKDSCFKGIYCISTESVYLSDCNCYLRL